MASNRLLVKLEKLADTTTSPRRLNTSSQSSRSSATQRPADPDFSLRTDFMNPMCDAAMSLIGLAINLETLEEYDDIEELYRQVHIQVTNSLEEMRQLSYERVQIAAYSYALCLYLDEVVMGTPWGRHSSWSHRPLLGDFHDETTGGDKFFTLLDRMKLEPKRHKDVLEFMYLILCMGLKGKHGITHDGNQALENHITELRKIIRKLRGPLPDLFPDALSNVVLSKQRLRRYWPWWSPLLVAVGAIAAMYTYYSYQLHVITTEVIDSLNSILQQ